MDQELLESALRAGGLRVTPQRRTVWGVFERGDSEHLTAEEVFGRVRHSVPSIARATVYNALPELVRAGLLRTVESRGALLYEVELGSEHQHFRCHSCGSLCDVQVEGIEGLRLLSQEPGEEYVVEWSSVLFEGLCGGCARTRANRA